MPLYYLAFSNSHGCIVAADNANIAPDVAWSKGCNPGGGVLIYEIPPHLEHNAPESERNRVLSETEMAMMWGVREAKSSHFT